MPRRERSCPIIRVEQREKCVEIRLAVRIAHARIELSFRFLHELSEAVDGCSLLVAQQPECAPAKRS